MIIVSRYGIRWARNKANIAALRAKDVGDPRGVYILCDGSMPVYLGRGRIWGRIRRHNRGTKARYWDHFSWFALGDRMVARDIEALLLRMLPFYLRSLNKQRADFSKAKKCREKDPAPVPTKMPKLAPRRRGRR